MHNLPKYRCHKVVGAIRIDEVSVDQAHGGAEIQGSGCSVTVDQGFLDRHGPKVGQYLVEYDDGYLSISPAEPFEAGYTPA